MPNIQQHKNFKWAFLALALAEVVAIEIPGALDYDARPYAGYELSAESANYFNSDDLIPHRIERVRPGSPAESAGLLSGDRVLSVEGIPFEDQERIIKLGRPKIGQTRSVVVEREGRQVPINLTYAKKASSYNFKYTAFAIIAFAFLGVGTICVWRYPSRATKLLFWVGLTGAFVFMHKPYFALFAVRSAFGMFRWLITSLWLAVLFHFLTVFPKPKRIFTTRPKLALGAIYAPCLLLFLLIAYYTVLPSGVTNRGGLVINAAFVFIGAYLSLAVAAFIHTYLTLLRSERTRGVRIMAIGTALGILPIALSIIIVIITPKMPLPGRDYYILTLVLIPLSFGYAVWEAMRATEGASLSQRPHAVLPG
jgi:hypothetical protein